MSRNMDQEDPANSNFLASALDMLTCGLGATALLFILFSVVHVEPEKAAGVDEFLNVRFDVVDGSNRPVQLKAILQPPGRQPVEMFDRFFDPLTGRLSPSPVDQDEQGGNIEDLFEKGGGCSMVGFALSQDEAGVVNGHRIFRLHIRRPIVGRWTVSARYSNIAGGIIARRSDPPIAVNTIVTTRDVQRKANSKVSFSQKTDEISVNIKP
jgi:hypothetical protein